jgi:hypothetical protein
MSNTKAWIGHLDLIVTVYRGAPPKTEKVMARVSIADGRPVIEMDAGTDVHGQTRWVPLRHIDSQGGVTSLSLCAALIDQSSPANS